MTKKREIPQHGLVFSFKDVQMECEVIKTYAKRFLLDTSVPSVDIARGQLQTIWKEAPTTKTTRWTIPAETPLCSVWSEGDSQPGKQSKHHVRAELSFAWDVRPLDEGEFKGRSHFLLENLASTVVSITDKRKACIAQWTVDVADHQSPGTHFHAQFKKFGSKPYPDGLDVPRLPSIPMSPFLVFEFVVAELFQDKWRRHAVIESDDAKRWRGIQRPRLQHFFAWQIKRLTEETVGSPLMQLKIGKPSSDLFYP